MGTTDSNGKITANVSQGTIYLKTSNEAYSGSTYIGASGGMKTVNLAGTTAPTGFPIWVIAIAILIGCVVVIVAIVLKNGCAKEKHKNTRETIPAIE